jgi:hypothetical protein
MDTISVSLYYSFFEPFVVPVRGCSGDERLIAA